MENRIARLLTKIFSINFLQFLLLNILKNMKKKFLRELQLIIIKFFMVRLKI